MFKIQKKYIILTIILFLVELFIGLFVHDQFIRPNIGDFLVVILLYCLIKSFLDLSVLKAALYVLLFSYIVEILQYFHIARLLGFEKTSLAGIIIGNSFSWKDIVAYTSGIALVLLLERVILIKQKGYISK